MAQATKVITTFGRLSAVSCAVVTLLGFGVCLWMLFDSEPTSRFSRDAVLLNGGIGSLLFFTGFIGSVFQCFKPSRLLLSPAGFKLEWIWSLPLIEWSDVECFGLKRQGPVKHVGFRLTPTASENWGRVWWRLAASDDLDASLFTGIGKSPDLVLTELREWHRQYGG